MFFVASFYGHRSTSHHCVEPYLGGSAARTGNSCFMLMACGSHTKTFFFFAVGVGPGDHAIVYDFSFHVVRLQTGCGCGHG